MLKSIRSNHDLLGNSFIHIDKIDYCVEVDAPLIELRTDYSRLADDEKDVYENIGRNIAGLIEDGSTLQMGIGNIPDAVLHYLMISKILEFILKCFLMALLSLVEKGILTNERKTLHPGKIIASFVLGTRKLYDFIDNDPLMEFHPSDYTNDPFIIAKNDKMVAINSALAD